MIENPEDVDPRNANGEDILNGDQHGGLGYALTPLGWVVGVLKTLKDVDPGPECLEKAVTNLLCDLCQLPSVSGPFPLPQDYQGIRN